MIDFCHIVPTPHLDLVKRREVHLVLAHLIEEDEAYRDFYNKSGAMLIMDNSAFEMYKREQPSRNQRRIATETRPAKY